MNIEQTKRTVNEQFDLRELILAIAKGKWIIVATTALFTLMAIIYALNLPNIYKSEVTLAPASDSTSLNIPGQLGGLAALAGVNLGNKGGDKTALALEILKSRQFLGRFIEDNDLYVTIMATEGWDRVSNNILIDPTIYNEKTKQWVRKVEPPFTPKPSVLETIVQFKKIYTVNQDKITGMVSLSIEHYSPFVAKQIVDKLVIAINEEMRSRDLSEADKSVAYLNKQISQTHLSEIKTMLFSLIEDQTKTLMLANVRNEYVFKTVDPAVVSENKSKPSRALIVLLSLFIGGILSTLFVLVKKLKEI